MNTINGTPFNDATRHEMLSDLIGGGQNRLIVLMNVDMITEISKCSSLVIDATFAIAK